MGRIGRWGESEKSPGAPRVLDLEKGKRENRGGTRRPGLEFDLVVLREDSVRAIRGAKLAA